MIIEYGDVRRVGGRMIVAKCGRAGAARRYGQGRVSDVDGIKIRADYSVGG